MDKPESFPWGDILVRIFLGLGLMASCVALDVLFFKSGLLKAGYSHPHGLGTVRQLEGWLWGWTIGWALMRVFIIGWVRVFSRDDIRHLGRAGIWIILSLIVLLSLPAELPMVFFNIVGVFA